MVIGLFSSRLSFDGTANPLIALLEKKRARAEPILDLTGSNPTQVNLPYDAHTRAEILRALTPSEAVLTYTPSARGLLSARNAISHYYHARGASVSPDHCFITASTSDSYHLLFKLLANPGDGILVPEPSYPLLDPLLALDGLHKIPYRMRHAGNGRWPITARAIEEAILTSTVPIRAIVVINPNNPTGSFLHDTDWQVVLDACKRHHLALISDDVFWDYPLMDIAHSNTADVKSTGHSQDKHALSPPIHPHLNLLHNQDDVLLFRLNGISKLCGLPQLKLGWIALGGPPELTAQAIDRLDVIADCYLSANAQTQLALDALLALDLHTVILARVRETSTWLSQFSERSSVIEALPREGGWAALITLKTTQNAESIAYHLLHAHNLFTHPGYLFDLHASDTPTLVVSLLTEPEIFKTGLMRIQKLLEA